MAAGEGAEPKKAGAEGSAKGSAEDDARSRYNAADGTYAWRLADLGSLLGVLWGLLMRGGAAALTPHAAAHGAAPGHAPLTLADLRHVIKVTTDG